MAKVNRSDVPIVDMITDQDETKALHKGVKLVGKGRGITGIGKWVAGIAANAIITRSGQTVSKLAEEQQVSQADVSKGYGVVSVFGWEARTQDGPIDPEMAVKVDNLKAFWAFHWAANPVDHPAFLTVAAGLTGQTGDDRADAICVVQDVYGAPSSAYMVATGAKFHEDDPRNLVESGDDGDDGDDDEQGETDFLEMLRNAASQCHTHGVTVTEVLAVVNEVYAS